MISQEEIDKFCQIHKKINDNILEAFYCIRDELAWDDKMEFKVDYDNKEVNFTYEGYSACGCCQGNIEHVTLGIQEILNGDLSLNHYVQNAKSIVEQESKRDEKRKKEREEREKRNYESLKQKYG